MGKVYSLLSKPVRTFNIESRAERILSRSKPIAAPQYDSVKRQKELADQLNPDFMETHKKKDLKLHNHLKDVFVSSTDSQSPQKHEAASNRPLPQNRSQPVLDTDDMKRSHTDIKGKCTLLQAMNFISMHQLDPVEHSVEKISQKHGLDKQVVENIVKHFHILNSMDVPKTNEKNVKMIK